MSVWYKKYVNQKNPNGKIKISENNVYVFTEL